VIIPIRLLEPIWLLLLPLPLLVLVALTALRRRAAVRFTGTAILADLGFIPKGLRPARLTAALAATLLLLTLSEPRLATSVEERRANVVLVVDVSGSMSAGDVAPTRLDAAKSAAKSFVAKLPPGWRGGIVAFSERAFVLAAPTEDRAALTRSLDSLTAQGGTATGDAIDLAVDVGRSGGEERLADAVARRDGFSDPSATVLVLLSDGQQTAGTVELDVAATRAARLGIPVHTIALGTDTGVIDVVYPDGKTRPLEVPPDFQAAARVAQVTGGEFFTAVTERELAAVYDSVVAVLESDDALRDLTAPFVLTALVLLAAAALLLRGRAG
jgi:Ca-activated chloride channel family protein